MKQIASRRRSSALDILHSTESECSEIFQAVLPKPAIMSVAYRLTQVHAASCTRWKGVLVYSNIIQELLAVIGRPVKGDAAF